MSGGYNVEIGDAQMFPQVEIGDAQMMTPKVEIGEAQMMPFQGEEPGIWDLVMQLIGGQGEPQASLDMGPNDFHETALNTSLNPNDRPFTEVELRR